MKKKYTYIIIGIVAVAIVILIVSKYYPPPKDSEAGGTIGKVDKYRNEQVNQKNVLLRSDILKDTAAIAVTMKELLQFCSFGYDTQELIDTWWIPQLKRYFPTPKGSEAVQKLTEYSDFLKNNLNNLISTVEMLSDFYTGKSKDQSVDVEGKMFAFINFVSQMAYRDSVFEETINNIDDFIRTTDNTSSRKEEIKKLKEIRDRMLVDDFVYSVAIGDNKRLQSIGSAPCYTNKTINSFYPQAKQVLGGSNQYMSKENNLKQNSEARITAIEKLQSWCSYSPYVKEIISGFIKCSYVYSQEFLKSLVLGCELVMQQGNIEATEKLGSTNLNGGFIYSCGPKNLNVKIFSNEVINSNIYSTVKLDCYKIGLQGGIFNKLQLEQALKQSI